MPGHHVSDKSRTSIDERFMCVICKQLAKEAMQISCGHLCCNDDCLQQLRSECPLDGEVLDHGCSFPFPDNCARREIRQVRVQCPFTEKGCEWEEVLSQLEEHSVTCEYMPVQCVYEDCGATIMKRNMTEHLQRDCPFRVVACEQCNEEMPIIFYKQHMEDSCPEEVVKCERCNAVTVKRKDLVAHLSELMGDCVSVKCKCPFEIFGCPEQRVLNGQEKKMHLEKAAIEHSLLLLREQKASRCPDELTQQLRKRSDAIETRVDSLDSALSVAVAKFEDISVAKRLQSMEDVLSGTMVKLEGFSSMPVRYHDGRSDDRRMTALENKTADHEVLFAESKREQLSNARATDSLKVRVQNLEEVTRAIQRRMDVLENSMKIRNAIMGVLEDRLRSVETARYDGVLIWKIKDFWMKRGEAESGRCVSFYSPCFYSSPRGYKLCARIFLDGDGMGRGTHISIFAVMMQGEFDAILEWPFRSKISIAFINQQTRKAVIKDTFRPDPNSSSFMRPKNQYNIASGFPKFFDLKELKRTEGLIKDNCIFVEVKIHPAE